MRNIFRRSLLTLTASAVLSASLSVLPNIGFGSFVSPAHAQDCHWEVGAFPADGGLRNEEWVCPYANVSAPNRRLVPTVDPCFIAQNAMRPCKSKQRKSRL